jgi:hypothetical protein
MNFGCQCEVFQLSHHRQYLSFQNLAMKIIQNSKEYYESIIDGLELDDNHKRILKISWLDYFLLMNLKAQKGWKSFNYAQLIVIFLSLLIPVIEGTKLKNFEYFGLNLGGLTVVSVMSLTIATLTALNRQLGFDAKWRHYRKNTEMMRNEGDDYLALSGSYQNFTNHNEAFKLFITTITAFKRQEVNTYFENDKNFEEEKKNDQGKSKTQ